MKYILPFLILPLLALPSLNAQDTLSAIEELKKGVLLVRLPSNQRKIQTMEEVLANAESASSRRQLKKRLEATREETRLFNESMVAAFREKYSFSDYRFFYDYQTPALKQGNWDGIFLNENLEETPGLEPESGPFMVLGFGKTKKDYSDGVEAMYFMDQELERMQEPFPYYQRLNDLAAFFYGIFPAPNQELRDALRVVEKMNVKLQKHYERTKDRT